MEPFLAPLQQWLLFISVSVGVGCVAWRLLVVPGALRRLSGALAPELALIEHRVAQAGTWTGLALLLAWLLRMVVQVMAFRDPFVPLWEDISFLLFETFWGTVWMAQGVIVPLLTIAFWRAAASSDDGHTTSNAPTLARLAKVSPAWLAATVLTVMLVASLALSSHAMGVEAWRPLIVLADGVHTLAAGVWIGALGLILTVGRPSASGQTGRELFAVQIRSFSPAAIASVAALVSMGIVLAWTHLTTLSDLWTVNYGRILSAKIVLAMAVLLAGLVNWRRGIPAVATARGSRTLWRRAALEVSLAMGVLLLTAVLVHSAKP